MSKDLCRLCTEPIESTESVKLFARNRKELLQRIKKLTGIMLKNVYNLPQQVCQQCEKQLEEAYSFRERCIKSHAYFTSAAYRKMLQTEAHNRTNNKRRNKKDVPATVQKNETIKEEFTFERMEGEFELDSELSTEVVLLKCEPAQSELNESRDFDALLSDDDLELSMLQDEQQEDTSETALNTQAQASTTTVVKNNTAEKQKQSNQKRLPNQIKERKKRKQKETNFICDQCGNHFKAYNHFQMHLKRHTGEKSHQCEVCPNKFYTYSELTRHMRRHTGERPFACKYCQRRFTDYSTRVKHERTHTNERPFACTYCNKAFTTSYILKNHMLVHTGERSFQCGFCNKSFQRQTNLITHYRSILHKQNVEKQQTCSLELNPIELPVVL